MHTTIQLTVNNAPCEATVDTRTLLVDFLRDQLDLTGTHLGCATGNCGACTVVLDGLTVKACTILAADAAGSAVTNQLRAGHKIARQSGDLHPIQDAFVKHHALQCGFCNPRHGLIRSATAERKSRTRPRRRFGTA